MNGPRGPVLAQGRTKIYAVLPEDAIVVEALLSNTRVAPTAVLNAITDVSAQAAAALFAVVRADLRRVGCLAGGDGS
jgi:hypothetical protein